MSVDGHVGWRGSTHAYAYRCSMMRRRAHEKPIGATDYEKWDRLSRAGGDLDQEAHWLNHEARGQATNSSGHDSVDFDFLSNGGALCTTHQSTSLLQGTRDDSICYGKRRWWQPNGESPPSEVAIVDLAMRKLESNGGRMELKHLCTRMRECRVAIDDNAAFGALLQSKGMTLSTPWIELGHCQPGEPRAPFFDSPPSIDEIEEVQLAAKRLANALPKTHSVKHLTTAMINLHPEMQHVLELYAGQGAHTLMRVHVAMTKLLQQAGFTIAGATNTKPGAVQRSTVTRKRSR